MTAILGCSHPDHSVAANDKKANPTSTGTNRLPRLTDTIFAGTKDIVILVNDGGALVKGRIVANSHQPKYALPVWQGDVITAIIKPLVKGGNVRFSQVQKPGGKFDGPFGDSIRCAIESNGYLHFIIGENQMTGDPYTGDFVLHITVK